MRIAFSLREFAPVSYWESQSIRKLHDWLEVMEAEAERIKKK